MIFEPEAACVRPAAARAACGTGADTAPPRDFASLRFRHELPADVMARFRQTNVLVSVLLATWCLGSIAGVAALMLAGFGISWPLALAFYPLAGAVIARQQRCLELLVHDGSHQAWCRETARKPAAIVRALAWHGAVVIVPAGLAIGWSRAVAAWVLFWLVPQFVFLPWLRFVAELEEHDYSPGSTEARSTFTNVGWLHRWIVHPMNDGLHLIHHAYPRVPQWKHAALHRLLLKHSQLYREAPGRTSLPGDTRRLGQER